MIDRRPTPMIALAVSAHRYGLSTDVAVWCDWCRRYHLHGMAAGEHEAHRLAHCIGASPYLEAGYLLVDAGPADAAVLADMKRRRPRGPAGAV